MNSIYSIGFDIGSSSVKAALINLSTGEVVGKSHSPDKEMEILSAQPDWAEQHPDTWWKHLCLASQKLISRCQVVPDQIKSVGISYQMHGLVIVDKAHQPIRPAIIWCDSRAVSFGDKAFKQIGTTKCLECLLNSPGNFTASKLAWVRENEPRSFDKIYKVLLPGDYIVMRLTGEVSTTIQGLSEGMFWNFKAHKEADFLLDALKIPNTLLPPAQDAISLQGKITSQAAKETGLAEGIPVTYRSGDQPNNAMSLNVLNPGEIAATGGTSGVVFGVVDRLIHDESLRVNSFAHVNHSIQSTRIGILLCINGTGSAYRFIRQLVNHDQTAYADLEKEASEVGIGADGLRAYPFGNGAERMLLNQNPGARFENIYFNVHRKAHFLRATLESIAFSFAYGIRIFRDLGIQVDRMKAGNDNLFQSLIFSQTLANIMEGEIQLFETTGAVGAAKASGVGIRHFDSLDQAMSDQKIISKYEPNETQHEHQKQYHTWVKHLHQ